MRVVLVHAWTDQGELEGRGCPAVAMRRSTVDETRGGGSAWASELVWAKLSVRGRKVVLVGARDGGDRLSMVMRCCVGSGDPPLDSGGLRRDGASRRPRRRRGMHAGRLVLGVVRERLVGWALGGGLASE